jgi:high-affinity nickel-transport protein
MKGHYNLADFPTDQPTPQYGLLFWLMKMPPEISLFSFFGILILGFFLGMRHATDPDHVIAVMTIVTRQRSVGRAGVIGALWGVGHTLTIFLVGAAIILFKISIPPRLGLSMEFGVGLMLIVLGLLNLTGTLRNIHRRLAANATVHKPVFSDSADSFLERSFRGLGLCNVLRPLIVGTVHGLAGSAAVAILVMATIPKPSWALAYLLLFGMGTIAGMMTMTAAMAVPIAYTGRRMSHWNQAMTIGSGVLSVAFGMLISFQIGIGGGLFTGNPHWLPR